VPAETKSFREVTAKADADFQAGNLDAAIQEYNRVIALNLTPQQASVATMRRGNCYYAKHEVDRAIADFDQALRLDPTNAGAYDNRANALDARGDRDDAIKDYNESVRLNPRNIYVYINRAILLAEEGNFNSAFADYAKALTINPKDEMAYTGRAFLYLMQKAPAKALKEANAAIAIAPGRVPGHHARARAYIQMGRYAEAESEIKTIMDLKNSDRTEALSMLAWFRATCPDPHFRNGTQALDAAQQNCQSKNFFGFDCQDTLAAAYAEIADFDQAVKYETQAVETAPSGFPNLSEMKKRLELYKQHQPYREEPNAGARSQSKAGR
jgi:tetratricopeptide (TPR) repeat protein